MDKMSDTSENIQDIELAGPRLCMVGVNHDTTPVSVRERLSIPRAQMQQALDALRRYVPQGVILATCNRTEVYVLEEDGCSVREAVCGFYREWAEIPEEELEPYLHHACNRSAMRHLSETAAGLRSMIVGEHEVLGQVGQALEEAEQAEMVNLPLRNLFQHAIRTGRRVREDTGISKNALSISSVAVDTATRLVGDIHDCRVLLIGAGEAGKLVARTFSKIGVSRIVVASRTLGSAQELASLLGGTAVAFEDIRLEMEAADILITCTGSPQFVIHHELVNGIMGPRRERPLVIVDIAVPRDVEPEVGRIEGVSVYDIDDFTHVSRANRKAREREIDRATEVVEEELERLVEWWQGLDAKPMISALMKMAEDIRRRQLKATLKKLPPLSEEERESLEAMTRAIVNKILHHPIKCLRSNGQRGKDFIGVVEELFDLDGKGSK
jgi:glutamyl-tRNA reductase